MKKLFYVGMVLLLTGVLWGCAEKDNRKGNIITTPTGNPQPAESSPVPTKIPQPTKPAVIRQNDNSAAHNREVRYGKRAELNEQYRRATEIGNRYGIDIRIADLVEDSVLNDGDEREYNPEIITAALTAVDRILAAYPEGFFDQLVYGEYSGMEISLIGFCTIGMGFVTTDVRGAESVNEMCLDIADYGLIEELDYNLPHELTHMIDFRIEHFKNWESPDLNNYEEKWAELNPKDLVYAYGDSELEELIYDKYPSYFSYSYGCSSPLEDRATFLGELMKNYLTKPEGSITMEPEAYAKMEFWCHCCREAFDTKGWPEQTPWEIQLEAEKPTE